MLLFHYFTRLAGREVFSLICKAKGHYRVYKSPLLVPNLSQLNPAHILTHHSFKIYLNIIPPSTLWSHDRSVAFIMQLHFCMNFSSFPCVLRAPPISSPLITVVTFGQLMKLLFMQFSATSCHSSPLVPHVSPAPCSLSLHSVSSFGWKTHITQRYDAAYKITLQRKIPLRKLLLVAICCVVIKIGGGAA